MITVSHLTKYYGGHLAVNDLSFEIDEGHVYGFLGPNGAGKSTTMNIMTGCLSATEGTITIDGYDIFDQPKQAKKQIGYLPEQPPLYINESPVDYLRFVGEAKGLRGDTLHTQIEEVIRQIGIEHVCNRRIGTLSKGYKQRVGIAQALLGNPKVIILDEPTVGLDPIQIIEIRDLIRDLGKTHTVIFSSHVLSEVQTICDRILMIAHGKLVAFDETGNLEKQLLSNGEINITTDADTLALEALLANVNCLTEFSVQKVSSGYSSAYIKTEHNDIYAVSSEIFHACAEHNITLFEMSLKKANLEDVFLELAGGDTVELDNSDKKTHDEERQKGEVNEV
ncbi:MAG: ABC transporter ATP-binding protein [Lachnospiraceae bacterium]|nr:ABC transporter ATP-binding protein [Lachnospiraceae bacterium]